MMNNYFSRSQQRAADAAQNKLQSATLERMHDHEEGRIEAETLLAIRTNAEQNDGELTNFEEAFDTLEGSHEDHKKTLVGGVPILLEKKGDDGPIGDMYTEEKEKRSQVVHERDSLKKSLSDQIARASDLGESLEKSRSNNDALQFLVHEGFGKGEIGENTVDAVAVTRALGLVNLRRGATTWISTVTGLTMNYETGQTDKQLVWSIFMSSNFPLADIHTLAERMTRCPENDLPFPVGFLQVFLKVKARKIAETGNPCSEARAFIMLRGMELLTLHYPDPSELSDVKTAFALVRPFLLTASDESRLVLGLFQWLEDALNVLAKLLYNDGFELVESGENLLLLKNDQTLFLRPQLHRIDAPVLKPFVAVVVEKDEEWGEMRLEWPLKRENLDLIGHALPHALKRMAKRGAWDQTSGLDALVLDR